MVRQSSVTSKGSSAGSVRVVAAAEHVGATDSASGGLPLAGVRVLEVTLNFAGPYAGLILADLGAEVIKLESPRGDESRRMPPFDADGNSVVFASLNRGKYSVALDLRRPDDLEQACRLAATCNVVVQNLRPGTMEALGLGWETLHRLNPRALYCSITAFGEQGDLAKRPGYDAVVQAHTGLMDLTGPLDGDPVRVGAAVLDVGAGMWAALQVLAALPAAAASGQGRQLSVSLMETSTAFMVHHVAGVLLADTNPTRQGSQQHNMAPYECFNCTDGQVMLAAASDGLWERLCGALRLPRLAMDPRFATVASRVAHRRELRDTLGAALATYSAAALVALLSEAGIPAAPVRSVREFVQSGELLALNVLRPVVGLASGLPVTPVAGSAAVLAQVPALGADTARFLADLASDTGSD